MAEREMIPPIRKRHRQAAAEQIYGKDPIPPSVVQWIDTGKADPLGILRVAAEAHAIAERRAFEETRERAAGVCEGNAPSFGDPGCRGACFDCAEKILAMEPNDD